MPDERLLPKGSKSEPLDVINYEIDMWRRCYAGITYAREVFQQRHSPDNLFEYNLRIEGFLLHTRNLLGFFTNQLSKPTDLGIRQEWALRRLGQRSVASFMKRARDVNNKHRGDGKTCYDEISKFLNHCSDQRFERAKSWETDGIFTDMHLILQEFESAFVDRPHARPEHRRWQADAQHTVSFEQFRVLTDPHDS
jgi:hypothetical protein